MQFVDSAEKVVSEGRHGDCVTLGGRYSHKIGLEEVAVVVVVVVRSEAPEDVEESFRRRNSRSSFTGRKARPNGESAAQGDAKQGRAPSAGEGSKRRLVGSCRLPLEVEGEADDGETTKLRTKPLQTRWDFWAKGGFTQADARRCSPACRSISRIHARSTMSPTQKAPTSDKARNA